MGNKPALFKEIDLRRARKVAALYGDIVKITPKGEILLVPNNGESDVFEDTAIEPEPKGVSVASASRLPMKQQAILWCRVLGEQTCEIYID